MGISRTTLGSGFFELNLVTDTPAVACVAGFSAAPLLLLDDLCDGPNKNELTFPQQGGGKDVRIRFKGGVTRGVCS
jgi:hypothetical protein